jgi:hypothetical protein
MDPTIKSGSDTPEFSSTEVRPASDGPQDTRKLLRRVATISLCLVGLYVFHVVAVFYGLLLLLIATHEAGHFIAGSLCGFRTISFRVGPLELRRVNILELDQAAQWTKRWKLRTFEWGTGSVAMAATSRSTIKLGRRYCVFLMGGPLANLVLGLLAFPVALHDSGIGAAGKFFVTGSVLLGLGNLFPFVSHGLQSDGRRLSELFFSRTGRERQFFSLRLFERVRHIHQLIRAEDFEKARESVEELSVVAEALAQRSQNSAFTAQLDEIVDNLQKLRIFLQSK